MRILQTMLALAISLGTAGVASAACETKKCPASEAVDAVLAQIATDCVCNPDDKSTRKDYTKCAKGIAKEAKQSGALSGSCSKAAKQCALKSTCGNPGKVACCEEKNNGSIKAYIAKNETKCTKKGSACSAFTLASEACSDEGKCATTTSTSINTTSTSTSTSTTVPECGGSCPGTQSFDFITGPAGGACGEILTGGTNATKLADIGCGGLDIGGGTSTVAEGPTPDGSISRFAAVCTGDDCVISPATCGGPITGGGRIECTNTGCSFGTPLPIANAGTSTCVVNTFRNPASGTLNKASGEAVITFPLNSQTFLTGDPTSPCPYCTNGIENPDTGQPEVLVGSLDDPKTGTCAGGANPDGACITTNSQGLTNDCLPGGVGEGDNTCAVGATCKDGSVNLGGLTVTLENATTGISTKTDPDGFFCPGQDDPNPPKEGCFGEHTGGNGAQCRTITVEGSPAGALVLGTPSDIILGSVFCIPAVPVSGPSDPGNLINFAANLPGPGAVALIGTGTLSDECPLGGD